MSNAAAADDGLTEYERQRLAHVARNREYMERLGVLTLAEKVGGGGGKTANAASGAGAASRKRVRPSAAVAIVGERKSSRLQRVAPEHDGSAVDAIDEEHAEGSSKIKKTSKMQSGGGGGGGEKIATGPAGTGIWASEDAALEASRQWLADARVLMGMRTAAAANPGANDGKDAAAQAEWRAEAVRRWGTGVPSVGLYKLNAIDPWLESAWF
jgi:methyl-CpG-binding domain protein 4